MATISNILSRKNLYTYYPDFLIKIYMIVHHGHSPCSVELNVEQLAHLQEVARSGKS